MATKWKTQYNTAWNDAAKLADATRLPALVVMSLKTGKYTACWAGCAVMDGRLFHLKCRVYPENTWWNGSRVVKSRGVEVLDK